MAPFYADYPGKFSRCATLVFEDFLVGRSRIRLNPIREGLVVNRNAGELDLAGSEDHRVRKLEKYGRERTGGWTAWLMRLQSESRDWPAALASATRQCTSCHRPINSYCVPAANLETSTSTLGRWDSNIIKRSVFAKRRDNLNAHTIVLVP